MIDKTYRRDHGRAALAATLINGILGDLGPAHPARAKARQLQKLFGFDLDGTRELIEKVPGKSMAKKAERIGIPRGALWALWHGKYGATQDVLARIEAAIEEKAS